MQAAPGFVHAMLCNRFISLPQSCPLPFGLVQERPSYFVASSCGRECAILQPRRRESGVFALRTKGLVLSVLHAESGCAPHYRIPAVHHNWPRQQHFSCRHNRCSICGWWRQVLHGAQPVDSPPRAPTWISQIRRAPTLNAFIPSGDDYPILQRL